MVQVLRFQKEHVSQIRQQERDLVENADFKPEHYAAFETQKYSYSIEISGRVMVCCGVVQLWPGRGEAWALIDRETKKYFVQLFKVMRDLLAGVECPRIEAAIRHDFPQGHRLIRLLGFELEAPLMRKYGVTGEDYTLYARVS